MKQDEYSTARPTLERWKTEIQQLNPGRPGQRSASYHSTSKTLWMIILHVLAKGLRNMTAISETYGFLFSKSMRKSERLRFI